MSEIQRTAEYWDARRTRPEEFPAQWWDIPAVMAYRNELLSDDPQCGFTDYVARRFGGRWSAPDLLVLGCGHGELERRLAREMRVGSVLGLDIAEQSLVAARAAAPDGFVYERMDLNSPHLGERRFDIILCAGVLHHLRDLEAVFAELERVLRPEGLLIVDEYVGPDRFQFSAKQKAHIAEAFRALPLDLRRTRAGSAPRGAIPPKAALTPAALWSKWRSGQMLHAIRHRLRSVSATDSAAPVLEHPRLPSAHDVRSGDPSEAVRSSEILPLLRERFEIAERRGLGFGLLQFALAGIAHNFVDRPDAVRPLIERERELMAAGELDDDFVFVVAKALG